MLLRYQDIFREGIPYFMADTRFSDSRMTRPHRHDFYEIFVLLQGRIMHRINGEDRRVGTGELCFLHPEDEHAFMALEGDVPVMRNLAFTPTFLDQVLVFLLGPGWERNYSFPQKAVAMDEELEVKLMALHLTASAEDLQESWPLRLARFRLQLGALLLQLVEPGDGDPGNIPPWLYRAIHELEKADNLEKGMDAFVELAGKSTEHLCRSMQKYLGMSPTQYINGLRLQKCAYLLRSTDRPITRIVFDSGFGNVSYFNRLFREQYGCTPREYRSRNASLFQL